MSREQAQGLILSGKVRVDEVPADKPGSRFHEDCNVEVSAPLHPYASRGGLKLEHALERFGISVEEKTAADVGASTGGFTDCLLQRGARQVFAVDVGYGQLHWKLQKDPRVTLMDRKNARTLTPVDFPHPIDLAVIDVSFISLKLILPPVFGILRPEGDCVALVKPQFEVGKDQVEAGGIIRNMEKHLHVLLGLKEFILAAGWQMTGLTRSPILGQKGNREYLIHCVAHSPEIVVDEESLRQEVLG